MDPKNTAGKKENWIQPIRREKEEQPIQRKIGITQRELLENWDPTDSAGKWFQQMQWAWGIHEIVTTNTACA